MDDADRADAELEAVLQAARQRAMYGKKLPYTGFCHNCGDMAEADAAFCSTECRDDYERRQAALQRGGNNA